MLSTIIKIRNDIAETRAQIVAIEPVNDPSVPIGHHYGALSGIAEDVNFLLSEVSRQDMEDIFNIKKEYDNLVIKMMLGAPRGIALEVFDKIASIVGMLEAAVESSGDVI